MKVIIVDGHSANFKPESQLPGGTLITIIGNLLRETSAEYTVVGKDQDWPYTPTGSDTIDIFSFEEDGNPCYLEINDDTEESIELFIIAGSISILRSIFYLSPN
jgi:hypothetical protein